MQQKMVLITKWFIYCFLSASVVTVVANEAAHHDHHESDSSSASKHDHHDSGSHAASKSGGVAAHVHGEVRLAIAQQGQELWVSLQAPASDIVGFERAPATDVEHNAVKQARKVLSDLSQWLQLPGLNCTEKEADVVGDFGGADKTDHGEFSADYSLVCENLSSNQGKPIAVQLTLAPHFPAIQTIQLQWATDAGQGSRVVESPAGSTTLGY